MTFDSKLPAQNFQRISSSSAPLGIHRSAQSMEERVSWSPLPRMSSFRRCSACTSSLSSCAKPRVCQASLLHRWRSGLSRLLSIRSRGLQARRLVNGPPIQAFSWLERRCWASAVGVLSTPLLPHSFCQPLSTATIACVPACSYVRILYAWNLDNMHFFRTICLFECLFFRMKQD